MKAEQNPIRRAMRKPTRQNAINAVCANCIGCTENHLEEGFRTLIQDCTAPTCPLFSWRPYQRKKPGAKTPETLRTVKPCQPSGVTSNPPETALAVRLRGART